jgi:hypothetical protein
VNIFFDDLGKLGEEEFSVGNHSHIVLQAKFIFLKLINFKKRIRSINLLQI